MSKIFDALRKAEKESGFVPLAPEARVEAREPQTRPVRRLESEFGYLANSIQSCFPNAASGNTIMVVACAEREGCTYVSTHLSRVLARTVGSPVLYLDGNFHDPTAVKTFGLNDSNGLSDVYANGKPRDLSTLIQRGDTDQLYVLGTGIRRVAPAAFFSSAQFMGITSSLRKVFRFTVIDAPPLMKYPDAIHLAARVDGVVMVVRHKHLKREVIRKGLELLEGANARVLGAVLNRRKFAIPDLLYKIVS